MRSGIFLSAASATRAHRDGMKVSVISESRDVGARNLPVVDVHAAPFGAALERRHRLAGIEDAVGIERRLHSVERGELRSAELHAHLLELLDADAVLAGDRAAHLDAELEDAAAELLALLQVAGFRRVVEDARMDVAVARVEDVAHGEAVLGR